MSESDQRKIQLEQRSALWQALLFIQKNLDQEITLEDIAAEAGYSPYHFHRLFKRFTGEPVKTYLRRLRLENAAFLLKSQRAQITDLAFESGFFTPETFTRAFNKAFGVNPSEFRIREKPEYTGEHVRNINKIFFKARKCIFKRYQGAYENSTTPEQENSLWHELFRELQTERGTLYDYELFGISYDDPTITDLKSIRYDACIALREEQNTTLPQLTLDSGLYVTADHYGSFEQLTDSYLFLLYNQLENFSEKIKTTSPPFEKFHMEENGSKIKKITIYLPLESRSGR